MIDGVLTSVLFQIFSVFVGYAFGYRSAVRYARKSAIEAGAAEWAIDHQTGERWFRFITHKEGNQ